MELATPSHETKKQKVSRILGLYFSPNDGCESIRLRCRLPISSRARYVCFLYKLGSSCLYWWYSSGLGGGKVSDRAGGGRFFVYLDPYA